ncbi:smg5 nonsense mediated mRNA decay factor isoform X1 [Bombus vancouverensis nearcticus]|uniref:smg5 nonsense mediated mRNA decay factor isoform X1 n=2 Tax=Bombus vancouverensis nearcticus TaxID=2705178 RepID=UPI00143BA7CB|nr:protein SMG5 [Bombus vancouverensis nearcticus]
MRRTYNAAADVRTTDSLEQTRRLHKGITDIAKRLDEQKSRALTITDLFTPSGEGLRVKLKDYCVRLITKDPVEYARKTEELLWRKAFYDIVYASKKLRKGNAWTETEKAMLSVHLAVGVGFYHHFILKLQLEYGLDLVGAIDFAYVQNVTGLSSVKSKISQSKHHTEEVKQCVMRLIHRSLVCLGDLARYKLELDPYWDPLIAKRYYKMAIATDPNIGMPHNQMGTIAGNTNYGLDAVYHYMRCILCSEPFEGAEGNLKRAIVTHSIYTDEKYPTHVCVSRLFSLLQLWDYDVPNSDRINQECQDLLTNIENCLSTEQSEPNNTNTITSTNEKESNIEVYLQNCKNEQTNCLTDDMIFKIVAICLMSISRLKGKESSEVQGVVAITLAILSQLIQFTITRLQESFIDLSLPNIEVSNSKNNNCNTESIDVEDKDNAIKQPNFDESNESKIINDNKASFEKESVENNSEIQNGSRKTRDKTKSLLTKLRRRKRRNSSDSDASDIDPTLESSSDEINSDVSETEDDILSEENVLSEDALSEDITDDEGASVQVNQEDIDKSEAKKINGHIEMERKSETPEMITEQVQNGEQTLNDQMDKKVNDKDSLANSGSIETNSNSTFDENSASSNRVTYIAQSKKENFKPEDVLNIINGKEILASIKICCDWLKSNPDIIRICGKSSRTLLKRVTILLNLINMNTETLLKNFKDDSMILSSADKLKECVKIVPLPEDIDLRGLNLLEHAQKSLNWKILHRHKMNKQEETLLRALKLIEFGHFLSSVEDAGVKYEEAKQLFVMIDLNTSNTKDNGKSWDMDHSRGKLMRHMGKLWLKAEVCALETRLRSRLMSPYLVPDHEALSKHTPALKRLVYAKKFIVVIPSVVVSALDEVKRISGRAREATRWLEAQLKRGSRFLRAQRPHERLALPFIKGPRPKDKEAWLFFQIIECCHYLTQQTKVGMINDAETPVVTLLTGCNPDDKRVFTFSPEGLAKSAGVNIEYIESFHTKWKASSKSHG